MTLDKRKHSEYHPSASRTRNRETVGIWISRPLHRKVKIEAARRGTDMRSLVEGAISKYVGREDDEQRH